MSDQFLFVQAQPFSLYGAGVVIGDTSITLKSFTTIDGANLTISDFGAIGFGTLSPGNGTLEEQISFSGVTQNTNGTATLTGVKSVTFIAPYTQTTGLLKSHAGSTSFIISNTSGFYDKLTSKSDDETITGLWDFPSGANNPTIGNITYVAPTGDTQIATKKYIDDIAIAGSPKATNAVYGLTRLSVAAVSPTAPISVGDNDPRVPTATEALALPGTVGTPSATNLYVTNLDTTTAIVASSVVRRLASTGDIAVPTTPGAAGDATSKSYVDGGTYRTFVNGVSSYSSTSGSQIITHGLGYTPKKVTINAVAPAIDAAGGSVTSLGVYNGTTVSTAYTGSNGSPNYVAIAGTDSTNIVYSQQDSTPAKYVATISVTTTSIILGWTKTGSAGGVSFMWEAE